MKHLNFEIESKPIERSTSKIVKLVAGAIFIVLVLEVWMVNRLSTYGNQLANIKQQESELSLENQILENQIASDSSLLTVQQKAQYLGFSQVSDYSYMKPNTIASAR